MAEVAVLGAGSWGTALALHLAGLGHGARLLFRRPEAAAQAGTAGENTDYLPGIILDPRVLLTADPIVAMSQADLCLVVTPVRGLETAAAWIKAALTPGVPVISCAKGLHTESMETPLATLARLLPDHREHLAVLSGPNFARDLAQGDPTAGVLAARRRVVATVAQAILSGGAFRVYTNDDPLGVELAGALKNVVALAAGVVDGLGYGSNTAAALMTRGLSEITRLGVARGGAPSTFAGLAGMGDLVLTCTGRWSRNRQVGRELGQGRPLDAIIQGMKMVAEGVPTARAARRLARQSQVEMPIVEQVTAVLFEKQTPAAAVAELLARDPRQEDRYPAA